VGDGELQGDCAAQAVPNGMNAGDTEGMDECRNVLGQLPIAKRPVDVGGVTVTLQLDRDDPVPGRERRQ
jgi:hypothetical protein